MEQVLIKSDWTEEELEQTRSDSELDNYYRRVMMPEIRREIATLKEEAGVWGMERRLKYLVAAQTVIECNIIELLALYRLSKEMNEPYIIRAFLRVLLSDKKDMLAHVQREMRRIIYTLQCMAENVPEKERITDGMIEGARAYPLAQIVDVRHNGMAQCVAHEDRNPSMDCRGNFAYCYACGFSGDAIKVYQVLYAVDFPTAVRALQ